jgi:hypothetical protein
MAPPEDNGPDAELPVKLQRSSRKLRPAPDRNSAPPAAPLPATTVLLVNADRRMVSTFSMLCNQTHTATRSGSKPSNEGGGGVAWGGGAYT